MITAYRPRPSAEPYKIKMVEPLKITTPEYRKEAIAQAHYNTFLLRSEDVYIDLLTDSGTSAMSDYQWAGMMVGDEAYAGSKNFYNLEKAVHTYYGYRYTVPTHQGRAAEHLLSKLLIKQGDIIPGNMYFTTTRAHQELAGGSFQDVIVDAAYDPTSLEPFKGNIDLSKLEQLIAQAGANRIPYINVQACVNMAGGQPFSLSNLRQVASLCRKNNIRVVLDATRALENAWFIQQQEDGQSNKSCAEILREIADLTDACTMSGKKDLLVNIGGFLGLRDQGLYEKACELVVLFEGLHTYGGLAGRDMEAMARGLEEAVKDEHLTNRIGQVHYLGKQLVAAGVPVVEPFGGHAIYLDAKRFLPHIPQDEFPAQSLCASLYVDSGIRAMERGIVSAGRDPVTGQNHYPELELVRLTIPRRVYSQGHMDVVADSVIRLYEERESIKGLQMTYEPQTLRFFQARFCPINQDLQPKQICIADFEARAISFDI
ncbi:MAG: tyrosine phenol-lyase [Candidatus Obscuribacterales bacterium]|nr:tyrosine phenol-lyase [Candidatus Obscuribacterales bacterium]